MVPPPRAPLRPDRLRALNMPAPVTVELDGERTPVVVHQAPGAPGAPGTPSAGKRVEAIGESWRVEDEWWRQPIARGYVEDVLEGGGRVVLYEDLITRERCVQPTQGWRSRKRRTT